MQNKVRKEKVASKNLQSGLSQPGESKVEIKYSFNDEKIDVEIRDLIRIRPQDFSAIKLSFEEWARQWD
jgi:hypothetical protein